MKRLVPVAIVIGLAVSSALAIKVGTDHDPTVSFSGFKAYAWKVKAPDAKTDPTGRFRQLDRLVRTTVDAELDARGYELVEGSPDFFVSYATAAGPAVYGTRFHAQGWTFGGAEIYAEGNLVLEFLDADGKELIWRGWAQGGVQPEKMDTRVPKAVKKILKRFPPPASDR